MLTQIAQPEIYVKNQSRYYCLYTENEFWSIFLALEELADIIREESNNMYHLIYRTVKIPNKAIVYEDKDQIVVSNEDYEKYRVEGDYLELGSIEITE